MSLLERVNDVAEQQGDDYHAAVVRAWPGEDTAAMDACGPRPRAQ